MVDWREALPEWYINTNRLNEIKNSIENEDISYGEIAELQSLSDFIPEDDAVLKEWAGVPEEFKGISNQ